MRTISRMTSRLIFSLYSLTVWDNEDDIEGDFEIDIEFVFFYWLR